jgi:hypothetical protein
VSVTFLFLVPLGLGILAAALYPPNLRYPWLYWLLAPWVSASLLLGVVLALAWEGAMCIVMAAPVVMVMATLGGVIVGLVVTLAGRRATRPLLPCLVLPLALGPAEHYVPTPSETRTVMTAIDIDADPGTVWRNVVRVPLIQPGEQEPSFFQRIGIPRPLEATLSDDGIGGHREARFEGGIVFHERVTEWQPERRLGFSIAVDPDSISPGVLDEHVRVGGPYFDVLYGRFVLEPRGATTRLYLSSEHRVSTHFNFYTGLWTEAVMRDIQSRICHVIARRASRQAGVRSSAAGSPQSMGRSLRAMDDAPADPSRILAGALLARGRPRG